MPTDLSIYELTIIMTTIDGIIEDTVAVSKRHTKLLQKKIC